VAEQNMVGVAAGLALSGKIVFVYSIIPFVMMRCFEQIRNDVCMHNLNVKIIGVGAGLNYGPAGPTHHAVEDIALMRVLPNMTVVSPGSPQETRCAIQSAVKHEGPVYVRLSKSYNVTDTYEDQEFCLGRGIVIRNGHDITLISTGSMVCLARDVADILAHDSIQARLINLHTIKPIDEEIILKAARETSAVFVIEEHSLIGGLGSAVAETLAESNIKTMFKRLALADTFIKKAGSREYLLDQCHLSAEKIAQTILKRIRT
jgi:transketolase